MCISDKESTNCANSRIILNEQSVYDICVALIQGALCKDLAITYNCTPAAISDIATRRSWKGILEKAEAALGKPLIRKKLRTSSKEELTSMVIDRIGGMSYAEIALKYKRDSSLVWEWFNRVNNQGFIAALLDRHAPGMSVHSKFHVSRRKYSCKHGHRRNINGKCAESTTYNTWAAMKSRCNNSNNIGYAHYCGRGIKVCDRWLGKDGFINFLADMGERPEGKTLDRIDNDGNYEPSNCRWATPSEQVRNRSCTILDEDAIYALCVDRLNGKSYDDLVAKYNYPMQSICAVITGKAWKDIREKAIRDTGKDFVIRKLKRVTEGDVLRMVDLRVSGCNYTAIGKVFNKRCDAISNLIKKRYKEVVLDYIQTKYPEYSITAL